MFVFEPLQTRQAPAADGALEPPSAGASRRAAAAGLSGFAEQTEALAPPGGDQQIPQRPLGPNQVVRAMSYYSRYGPDTQADIRAKVGLSGRGVDEDLVQAVARFQVKVNQTQRPSPPLAVDGMAGPRTLPILEPVGLATKSQRDAYVADLRGSADAIRDAPDLEQKADLFGKLINDRLKADGVPPVAVDPDPDVNRFTQGDWRIVLSHRTLNDPEAGASVAYHEARHAQQSWLIARMLAGRHLDARAIADEAEVPHVIALIAQAQPLAPDSVEAAQARGWHELEAGHKPLGQLQNERSQTTVAFVLAVRAHDADPSPERMRAVVAAFRARRAADLAERDHPTEYDAHVVEDRIDEALGRPRHRLDSFEEALENARQFLRDHPDFDFE